MKHRNRLTTILACTAAFWAASAKAETKNLYLTDTEILPSKIEAAPGDRIVISNGARTNHLVEITGRTNWFGRRDLVHDLAIPFGGSGVVPVDGKLLKPGSYNVECDVHKRMRATIVIRAPESGPEALHEGERRSQKH